MELDKTLWMGQEPSASTPLCSPWSVGATYTHCPLTKAPTPSAQCHTKDSGSIGDGSEICISRGPGEADAAGLGPHVENLSLK